MFAMIYEVYSQDVELQPEKRITVKGMVADENDEPLPSVAVWASDPTTPASPDFVKTPPKSLLSSGEGHGFFPI